MAEIWPSAGLDAVIAIFPKNGTNLATTTLRLFTNFTPTTVGSRTQGATSDYTEPSAGAYATQSIAAASWGANADYNTNQGRQTTAAQVTFPTATATWGTVNGFHLTTGTTILFA